MNLDNIKKRLNDTGRDMAGANSEWAELVGELTDYLNKERDPKYPEVKYVVVARLVAYIKKAEGIGGLRFFIKQVRDKGPWFFWWTVKPKPEKK